MNSNNNLSVEHWRYVNGVKFNTVVAAIENFSTREPAAESLAKLFAAIGRELGALIYADRQFHIFSNPDIQQLHILDCSKDCCYSEFDEPIEFRYAFDMNDKLKWLPLTYRSKMDSDSPYQTVIFEPEEKIFPPALRKKLGNPTHIVIAPFCRNDTPFGYYLFCWDGEELPLIYQSGNMVGNMENVLREGAINSMDYVHTLVRQLISNHFPIHRDTYIPSFQRVGIRPAGILFADIRNFTSAFEVSRLMEDSENKYPHLLTGFVKSYLDAASVIISQPGTGRIDKFLGDGIMATFSDYLAPKERNDKICCLLGLYSACMLHDAFEKLFCRLKEHPIFQNFLMESNYVMNIRLGIGIAFGKVLFDYFGSNSFWDSISSDLIGGYLEYTAIGDHVNTAQRLEELAAKPVSQVSVLERSKNRINDPLIAPILLSRTTFMRISEAIPPNPSTEEDLYRSIFSLKGKGTAIDAYEIFPNEINGDHIIRFLNEFAGKRIRDTVNQTWKDGRFQFDDNIVSKLADRYFPKT